MEDTKITLPNIPMFTLRYIPTGLWVKSLNLVPLSVKEWTSNNSEAQRFTPVESVRVIDNITGLAGKLKRTSVIEKKI